MGIEAITSLYNSLIESAPVWTQKSINLFLLIILVVVYSIFIWKLYRFVSRKNIIDLNLNQYNTSEHPFFSKLWAGILYVLEYIIIMPLLIFFWLVVFGVFLLLLTDNIEIRNIIVISATMVGAIRVIAFIPNYGKELSKDLAKLIPFTLLAIAMITAGFFNFERVLIHLNEIPGFFEEIIIYLLFIVALEILMRFIGFLFGWGDDDKDGE
ncbi:hypothetical protein HYT23_06615 [Candidatus Pacearchaeota archaeon]|nr:hypothetical protein [Candidatus Pacearchaeota archaeon]